MLMDKAETVIGYNTVQVMPSRTHGESGGYPGLAGIVPQGNDTSVSRA
jgi:hypothetical protein